MSAEIAIPQTFVSVSINAAPLHPNYGEKTAGQILAEMKKEDEDGEVDLNVKEYIERRDRARRSPYPTVVIEVRATPPPDFGNNSPPAPDVVSPGTEEMGSAEGVSKEAVQKLEALFGQSAAIAPKRSDDAFYDAIGKVSHTVTKLCMRKVDAVIYFYYVQTFLKNFYATSIVFLGIWR